MSSGPRVFECHVTTLERLVCSSVTCDHPHADSSVCMLTLRIALSRTAARAHCPIVCCVSPVARSCSLIASACRVLAQSAPSPACTLRVPAAVSSSTADCTLAYQMRHELAEFECTHMVECLVRTKPACLAGYSCASLRAGHAWSGR
jgi:hypothetical protein